MPSCPPCVLPETFRIRPRAFLLTLGLATALASTLAGCGGGDATNQAAAPPSETPVERLDAPLPEGAQAWSLLGQPLYPPPLPMEIRSAREENLEAALRDRTEDPEDPEHWIWVGRHEAYLGEYQDAVATFSAGLERFEEDARFLRHRGHRWITLRELDLARADLRAAVEGMGEAGSGIEPDGLPNPAGIPLTTLAFNAWYHLALTEYLAGDFEAALPAWEATLAVSGNSDLEAASRYWLHLTLRRLGEEARAAEVAAAISADDELLENHTYRDLLLHFRGDSPAEAVLPPDGEGLASVTALYGLGIHALLRGDEVEAFRRFQEILDRPDQWPAFGYVAAEVEMARRDRR